MRLIKRIRSIRPIRFLLSALLIAGLFIGLFAYVSPKTASAEWYSESWLYRKKLVIDQTKVTSGPHTNFPILVSLATDDGLRDHAQTDGDDLLFTSSDGLTKLDHEIETYDSSTGELAAWVRIPTLPSNSDTVIFMYYGNSSTSSQQNATAVWDSSYVGVWHLNNNNFNNSTSVANLNGTNTGTTNLDPAQIAGGRTFNSTTANNYNINVTDNDALDISANLTIEAWVRFTSTTGEQSIVDHDDWDNSEGYYLFSNGTFQSRYRQSTGVWCYAYSGATPSTATWYHVVGRYNSSQAYTIVNGNAGSPTSCANPIVASNDPLRFGLKSTGTTFDLLGDMDEVRISNTARSDGWISTEYANQNIPANFIIVDTEASPPSGTLTVSGNLTLTGDGAATVTAATNDPNISVVGNLEVGSGDTFTASDLSTATLNIDGNLTITGIFTAPSGTADDTFTLAGNFTKTGTFNDSDGRLVIDGAGTSAITFSTDTTFHDLKVATAGKTVQFDAVQATIIESGGNLIIQGTNCNGGRVFLDSEINDNDWAITVTGATVDIDYADIEDSTATGSPTANSSTQINGGNTGWTILGGLCGGGTDNLTSWSFQRKTFYDGTEDTYWRFSYDGTQIVVEYEDTPWDSGDNTWTAVASISVNTSDFSVWDNDTYVYIAYASANDILVQQGTLEDHAITWDTTTSGVCTSGVCVALNGDSTTNTYKYAYTTQDSSGNVWVNARYYSGTNYYMKAVKSSSANDLTAWGTVANISDTSNTSINVYGGLSSLGSADMYAAFVINAEIRGSVWDNDDSGGRWENTAGTINADGDNVDTIATGKAGLDANFSMSSDTSNNLHLAYIDSGDDVQYIKYSGGVWGGGATIDNTGTSAYATVSVDTTSNNVYVLYIRSSTVYYNKYTDSWQGVTDTGWTEGASPKFLTSNYADSDRIFAVWTSGSGPYTINWNYIIIPEKLVYLLVLGLLIPHLIRKAQKKRQAISLGLKLQSESNQKPPAKEGYRYRRKLW